MNEDAPNPELKPPLTYEQQLAKMKGRNLVVSDENLALEKLKQYKLLPLKCIWTALKKG